MSYAINVSAAGPLEVVDHDEGKTTTLPGLRLGEIRHAWGRPVVMEVYIRDITDETLQSLATFRDLVAAAPWGPVIKVEHDDPYHYFY